MAPSNMYDAQGAFSGDSTLAGGTNAINSTLPAGGLRYSLFQYDGNPKCRFAASRCRAYRFGCNRQEGQAVNEIRGRGHRD